MQRPEVQGQVARHECGGVFPQRGVVRSASNGTQHHRQVATPPIEGDHSRRRFLRHGYTYYLIPILSDIFLVAEFAGQFQFAFSVCFNASCTMTCI